MAATLSNPGTKVVPPSNFAHIVLKTHPSNLQTMSHFYQTFLSAKVVYSNEYATFLTYDSEHHRVAIVGMPDTKPRDKNTSGLFHFAYSFNNLNDLALGYLQRKANGIMPYWCVNHGPTVSMYYRDPDGNEIETQVECFERVEEATEFMMGEEFRENPIGVDFEPEELVRRLLAGEKESEIMTRDDIGPRGVPTFDE